MTNDILGLAYFVFEVSDLAAWHRLLVEGLGAVEGEPSADGARRYRLDARSGRILLVEGPADDLVALGFEARSKEAMWDVAMRARDEGAFVEEGLARDAAARGATAMVRFEEPNGCSIEVVHGLVDAATASPPRFVTGEQGTGHVALGAGNVTESRAFFEKVLGFRLSDRITTELLGGFKVDVTFLRVNRRHHTVALATGLSKHLHHFMVQLRTLDDLGQAYDRFFDLGIPVTQTLGRHPNDRMLSFYAKTPSGFEIEIGHGGVEVEDAAWNPRTYDRISTWGHRPPSRQRDLHTAKRTPETTTKEAVR